MLTVTEGAKQLLREMLLAHRAGPEASLRISMQTPGKLSLVLDSEAEGDQVVEHEGSKLILVSPELAPIVEEMTLGVQNTTEGPKLVVYKG